ncbi:MAG: glycosyltransferase [Candidatus Limnocylindrales bacterium]
MRPLRITMLLYGEIEHDSRVRREMSTLMELGHQVTVVTLYGSARPPFELDGARIVPLRPVHRGILPGDESPFLGDRKTGRIGRLVARGRWAAGYATTFHYWRRAALRQLPPADVWHGHDLLGLLTASALQRRHGGGLVHDSHELFLEAGSAARLPSPARRLLFRMERGASRKADAVITVNESIAEELRRRYGVRPLVVMNCPLLGPARKTGKLRDHLELGSRPVVLFHGGLSSGRGVEQLVDSLPLLPAEAAVVLLGYGDLSAPYSALAAQESYRGRLFVVPAVPIADLPNWVCDADVGVIAFQPVDRNNVLGTPNKLFEYLEAGVPMVVSDFPEMRRLVTETGAGIARDTSTAASLAAAIRELLDEPKSLHRSRKRSARHAAESTYNWGVQSGRLVKTYSRLGEKYGTSGSSRQ